jgi:hypothetical protein
MRVVYKHEVILGGGTIEATEGAKFVHFAEQAMILYAWVEFDPNAKPATLGYKIFGTGHPIEPPVDYAVEHRFTCLVQGGSFVWHLYQVWPR